MLAAILLLFASLVWTALVSSFNELLAARCVSGFASSAGEVSKVFDPALPFSPYLPQGRSSFANGET